MVLRDLWILRLRQILAVLLCFPVFPRFWSFLAVLPLLLLSLRSPASDLPTVFLSCHQRGSSFARIERGMVLAERQPGRRKLA